MEKFDGYTLMYVFKNLAGTSIESLAEYLGVNKTAVNRYLNINNQYKFPTSLESENVHFAADKIRIMDFGGDFDVLVQKFFHLLEKNLGMGRATAELRELYNTKEKEVGKEQAFNILLNDFFIKCKTGYSIDSGTTESSSDAKHTIERGMKKERINFSIIASADESEHQIEDLRRFLDSFFHSQKKTLISADLNVQVNNIDNSEDGVKNIYCVLVNSTFEMDMRKLFDSIWNDEGSDDKKIILAFICDINNNRRVHKSVESFEDDYFNRVGKAPMHYSEFATVKLAVLRTILTLSEQIISSDTSEVIKYDDVSNKIMVNGQELEGVEELLSQYANRKIEVVQGELKDLDEKYRTVCANYNRDNSNNAKIEMYRLIGKLQKKRKELEEIKFAAIKNAILVFERGEFQENLDDREKLALNCIIHSSDYDKANEILRDPEWKREMEMRTSILDDSKQTCVRYISGQKLLVSNLRMSGSIDQGKSEIISIYESILYYAEKYQVALEILYDYAEYLNSQKEYKKGLEIAKRLEGYKSIDSSLPVDNASLYYLIAKLFYGLSLFKDAEYYYNKTLDIYENNPLVNEDKIQLLYSDIAGLCWKTGKYIESKRRHTEIVEKLEKAANRNEDTYLRILAGVYNHLAMLANRRWILNEAVENHLKALDYKEKYYIDRPNDNDALLEISKTYNNLGIVYRRMDAYDKAEECYKKAIGLREEGYKRSKSQFALAVALTYSNYAYLMGVLKNTAVAEKYVMQAITIKEGLIAEGRRVDHSLAISFDDYGVILYHAGNRNLDAEKRFLAAIDTKERLIETDFLAYAGSLAISYFNYADLLALNNKQKAETYYLKAIDIQENLEQESPGYFAHDLCDSYYHCAVITEDKAKAKSRFEKAEEYGYRVLKSYPGFADHYKKLLEDYLVSINTIEDYTNEKDSILDKLNNLEELCGKS